MFNAIFRYKQELWHDWYDENFVGTSKNLFLFGFGGDANFLNSRCDLFLGLQCKIYNLIISYNLNFHSLRYMLHACRPDIYHKLRGSVCCIFILVCGDNLQTPDGPFCSQI